MVFKFACWIKAGHAVKKKKDISCGQFLGYFGFEVQHCLAAKSFCSPETDDHGPVENQPVRASRGLCS